MAGCFHGTQPARVEIRVRGFCSSHQLAQSRIVSRTHSPVARTSLCRLSLTVPSRLDRIWVRVPGKGFVGVGRVNGPLSALRFLRSKPLRAKYRHLSFSQSGDFLSREPLLILVDDFQWDVIQYGVFMRS